METKITRRPGMIGLGIGLVVLGILCADAFKAFGQITKTVFSIYSLVSVSNAPTSIAASSTATNVMWLDVRRCDSFEVELSGVAATTNAGSGGYQVTFYKSVDGSNADPTALTASIVNITGTHTGQREITNVTGFGDCGWLKVVGANTATAAVSSLTFKVVTRPDLRVSYPFAEPEGY